MDSVLLDGPLVSGPPVFHPLLSFEASEDECNWHSLIAKKVMEQPVVSFHCSSYPVPTQAKEEEMDATSVGEGPNEAARLLDGVIIPIGVYLIFFKTNGFINSV